MPTNHEIIRRWFDYQLGKADRLLCPRSSNIIATSSTIYSYGTHFPLAEAIRDERSTLPRLFLLNGDRYSVSTARHQSGVRSSVPSSVPSIIVPFSALASAGIVAQTVRPAEVLPDRWTPRYWTCDGPHETRNGPHYYARGDGRDDYHTAYSLSAWGTCEGGRDHVSFDHHLGASVFRADVVTRDAWGNQTRRVGVPFISAFDEQEALPLYFLAELPPWSNARTYEQAIADLAPKDVHAARAEGLEVVRQGDIFAIADPGMTRATLKDRGATFHDRKDGGWPIYGTAHTATRVAVLPSGAVYASGMLYHDPKIIGDRWRERDHARRRIADGKAWARVLTNTVPRGGVADPTTTSTVRAWTIGGGVD